MLAIIYLYFFFMVENSFLNGKLFFIFLQSFPCSDIMFENDYLSGSGAFMPELSDPEYCNASNTCLWELHLLKVSMFIFSDKYKFINLSLNLCERKIRGSLLNMIIS